jgi:hypothetical protein
MANGTGAGTVAVANTVGMVGDSTWSPILSKRVAMAAYRAGRFSVIFRFA